MALPEWYDLNQTLLTPEFTFKVFPVLIIVILLAENGREIQ
jgi:hypothetical protein